MEHSIEQARPVLGDLANAAYYHGTQTVITRNGRPIAKIAPIGESLITKRHLKKLFRHAGPQPLMLAFDDHDELRVVEQNAETVLALTRVVNSSMVQDHFRDGWSDERAAQLAADLNEDIL